MFFQKNYDRQVNFLILFSNNNVNVVQRGAPRQEHNRKSMNTTKRRLFSFQIKRKPDVQPTKKDILNFQTEIFLRESLHMFDTKNESMKIQSPT